jgi:hypothetical protein
VLVLVLAVRQSTQENGRTDYAGAQSVSEARTMMYVRRFVVAIGIPLLLLLLFILAGCSMQGIKTTAAEVEQSVITANDLQLTISEKGLCSSALSAIRRKYGDDPEMLEHVLGICGWSRHNIETMMNWVVLRQGSVNEP